jgi:hypothetical protein
MAKTKVNIKAPNLLSHDYIDLYVQILFFAFTIYIVYNLVSYITKVMGKGCGNKCRFLVQEGFATNFDDSKAYFTNLIKKCDRINDSVSALSTKVGDLEIKFGGLKKDICYVTLQVDESLQGNYASNVPDEELQFPPEEQKKRAEERKKGAAKYVINLKKSFVKTHNKVPLLECFEGSGMTDEQEAELKTIRDSLSSKVEEVKGNLSQFDTMLVNVQKEFAKDKLKEYYTTLNYNDKYIKQMQSAVAKAGKPEEDETVEGFADNDDSTALLDFKPAKTAVDEDDPDMGPEQRVNNLEDHYTKSAAMYNSLAKTFIRYNNTTKSQTETLKQAKKVVNDKDEQMKQMNANSDKAVKSA